MSKKKSFGVSSSLKRGLRETFDIVEHNSGLLRNAVIPLSRIEPDPDNPRNLAINFSDVQNGLNKSDALFDQKEAELQKLLEVAETIKKGGLLNPIIVYRYEQIYRIVAGERRFLAAILAGLTEIEARIYNDKPQGFSLRLAQWIENTAREDLSLAERIFNIQQMIDAYLEEFPKTRITATWLKDKTGLSLPQATYYMNVLNAPEDVKNAIQTGYLNSLDKAAVVATIIKPELRQAALTACRSGISLRNLRQMIARFKEREARGLPFGTNISLGYTQHPEVVKTIIQAVLALPKYNICNINFNDVKWECADEAGRAFKQFISLLENRMHIDA